MRQRAKLAAACAFALGLTVCSSAAIAAKTENFGKLGSRGEQLLEEAQQAGKSRLVLLIAVRSGSINQAVADISRLGGTIQYRDDTIGYVRASVPVAQVKAVAALSSVNAVDVDEVVPLPD